MGPLSLEEALEIIKFMVRDVGDAWGVLEDLRKTGLIVVREGLVYVDRRGVEILRRTLKERRGP